MLTEEEKIILAELEKYTNLEGSEIGDLCSLLISTKRLSDYFLTEKFHMALWDEIKEQLANFRLYSQIVEETEVVEEKTTRLEWISIVNEEDK